MNKEQSIKALQISAILFKYNIPIAEAKFIGSFIEELIQENKKQKEVIDKAINWTKEYIKQWDSEDDVISDMKILLNILKETE